MWDTNEKINLIWESLRVAQDRQKIMLINLGENKSSKKVKMCFYDFHLRRVYW